MENPAPHNPVDGYRKGTRGQTSGVWVFVVIILVASIFFDGHNQKGDINKKKDELAAIRDEIKSLKDEIGKATKEEKKTFELIEKLNKQVFLLNQLVNGLRAEADGKTRQINDLEGEISSLEKKIEELREFYARYVVAMYKGLIKNKWLYIINSASLDEALRRYRYFKAFTEKGEQVLGEFKVSIDRLESARSALQYEKDEKAKIIALKKGEESALEASIEDQKDLLKDIGKNKEALKKELEAKKQSEKKIGSLIDKLILKEEKAKKDKIAKTKPPKKPKPTKPVDKVAEKKPEPKQEKKEEVKGADEPADEYLGGSPVEDYEDVEVTGKSFSSMKGNLMKPVTSAKIFRGYGENKNEELNTVTLNYGIDFKVEGSQPVKCVADGVVSAIEWLPGYGSVIIITHTEGYRTVYGHLGTISVREGTRVKGGSVLGTVGRSLEGYIFHFEIWKGKQNINPSSWF